MTETMLPGVRRRGDSYEARPFDKTAGKKVTLGTAPTVEAANKLITDWKDSRSGVRTIKQIRHSWLTLHVSSLMPATEADYTSSTLWIEEEFGDSTPDELYDRFEDVQAKALEQSTNAVETTFAMLEWGRNRRLCRLNCMVGVVGRPVKKRTGKVILTEPEVRDLASHSSKVHREPIATRMAALILVEFGTMLRPEHLRRLRWRDLDFERNRIFVQGIKRGRPQWVAMLPIAREGFETLPPGEPDELVFQSVAGNTLSKATIANWFQPVRASYGRPDMWFYDLKSSGVTRLRHVGADPEHVAVQATHTGGDETIKRHYTQLDVERALQSVEEADRIARERDLQTASGASLAHSGKEMA